MSQSELQNEKQLARDIKNQQNLFDKAKGSALKSKTLAEKRTGWLNALRVLRHSPLIYTVELEQEVQTGLTTVDKEIQTLIESVDQDLVNIEKVIDSKDFPAALTQLKLIEKKIKAQKLSQRLGRIELLTKKAKENQSLAKDLTKYDQKQGGYKTSKAFPIVDEYVLRAEMLGKNPVGLVPALEDQAKNFREKIITALHAGSQNVPASLPNKKRVSEVQNYLKEAKKTRCYPKSAEFLAYAKATADVYSVSMSANLLLELNSLLLMNEMRLSQATTAVDEYVKKAETFMDEFAFDKALGLLSAYWPTVKEIGVEALCARIDENIDRSEINLAMIEPLRKLENIFEANDYPQTKKLLEKLKGQRAAERNQALLWPKLVTYIDDLDQKIHKTIADGTESMKKELIQMDTGLKQSLDFPGVKPQIPDMRALAEKRGFDELLPLLDAFQQKFSLNEDVASLLVKTDEFVAQSELKSAKDTITGAHAKYAEESTKSLIYPKIDEKVVATQKVVVAKIGAEEKLIQKDLKDAEKLFLDKLDYPAVKSTLSDLKLRATKAGVDTQLDPIAQLLQKVVDNEQIENNINAAVAQVSTGELGQAKSVFSEINQKITGNKANYAPNLILNLNKQISGVDQLISEQNKLLTASLKEASILASDKLDFITAKESATVIIPKANKAGLAPISADATKLVAQIEGHLSLDADLKGLQKSMDSQPIVELKKSVDSLKEKIKRVAEGGTTLFPKFQAAVDKIQTDLDTKKSKEDKDLRAAIKTVSVNLDTDLDFNNAKDQISIFKQRATNAGLSEIIPEIEILQKKVTDNDSINGTIKLLERNIAAENAVGSADSLLSQATSLQSDADKLGANLIPKLKSNLAGVVGKAKDLVKKAEDERKLKAEKEAKEKEAALVSMTVGENQKLGAGSSTTTVSDQTLNKSIDVTKEDAGKKAKEDADRKAKEDADRKAKEDAEKKLKEDAAKKAKEDADRKAKEDAEKKLKEEAERKTKEDAEKKLKEEAERKAKEETDAKAKIAAENPSKEEPESSEDDEEEPKVTKKTTAVKKTTVTKKTTGTKKTTTPKKTTATK